jgi:hypothetical protein
MKDLYDDLLHCSFYCAVIFKVKVKLSLCLTNEAPCHEGIKWSECIDPHFIDFATRSRRIVSFTLRFPYPRRMSPSYPGDRVALRTGLDNAEKRKFLQRLKLQPHSSPVCSLSNCCYCNGHNLLFLKYAINVQ